MTRLVLPWPTLADGDDPVRLTPQVAGWSFAGLRVLRLASGVPRVVETGDLEVFVLPLQGGCELEVDGVRITLRGRESVFTRVSDFAYVGRRSRVTLVSETGCQLVLPMAVASVDLEPRYGPAEAVPVEVRGAGPATRQVTGFGTPDAWAHADRLMACELITPGGNWSSYPPHKHDHTCEVANEEIYYFRVAGRDGRTPGREGLALHRTYDDEVDVTAQVRDGDVALVPRGYHGPCVAAPGYDLYYLNVLAGPLRGKERSMAFCDDPDHAWVRQSWAGAATDARCPVTSAQGRCHA
jgi:5-deoxy-glucuronate isomerase